MLHATISGNVVTQSTTATNHSILAFLTSTIGQISPARIRVDNNTVINNSTSGSTRGILVDTPDTSTSPSFDATVTNNSVAIGDSINGVSGLVAQARKASETCTSLSGNTVTFPNGTPSGIQGLRARQADTAVYDLQTSVSCTGTAATVLSCLNPSATTEVLGTINTVSPGTCLLPVTP
ncbi:hypothetical protein VZ94_13215 [Methylocucumis oryzae]|uniref:Right handed beta helix domain-containing protein n=1 Tax=Methylocucumis oryzae TaxID=1632867 RepID=A0A0F3IH94_9GAMM|nr:hypothetical protein VZ94_13215 [Methylocucumis oryzae]